MDNKERLIQHLKNQLGDIRRIVYNHGDDIGLLTGHGFKPVENTYQHRKYSKNGIIYTMWTSDGSFGRWHVDLGFYIGGTYVRYWDIEKRIDEIVEMYSIPSGVEVEERDEETKSLIAKIKGEINFTEKLVNSFGGWGEIGGRLRINGYFVSYDGGSVCNFYKNGICYTAHTNEYPKSGWHLCDKFSVYDEDNELSEDFSLKGEHNPALEKDFEVVLYGVKKLGHRESEKEKLANGKLVYREYRVRDYHSKTLETLGYFDTLEEAKKFAYDKAKAFAESIKDDRRRWAWTNPRDISDEIDYLAAFVYYEYDRHKCFVFVQGEY